MLKDLFKPKKEKTIKSIEVVELEVRNNTPEEP